jgi:hypothetical protein
MNEHCGQMFPGLFDRLDTTVLGTYAGNTRLMPFKSGHEVI